MTAQEYYDLLVKTSAEGGFPAVNAKCPMYLAADGKRCAVGVLLPTQQYTYPQMKDYLLSYSHTTAGRWVEEYFPEGFTQCTLREPQMAHDELIELDEWPHQRFVQKLNELNCFKDVQKMEVVS